MAAPQIANEKTKHDPAALVLGRRDPAAQAAGRPDAKTARPHRREGQGARGLAWSTFFLFFFAGFTALHFKSRGLVAVEGAG